MNRLNILRSETSCGTASATSGGTACGGTACGSTASATSGGCPFNQRNMVDSNLEDDKVEGLSTEREVSSIAKDPNDTNSKWVYPSELMFWNALKRKDKLDGVEKADMKTIIPIHNKLNEKTWKTVLFWEKVISPCVEAPTLLFFAGKSTEFSWKARIGRLLRWRSEYPFDRHDWVIQRSDKTIQRYVIDYYSVDSAGDGDGDGGGGPAGDFVVDTRPASDSVKMWIFKMCFWAKVWLSRPKSRPKSRTD
jgi:cytochrome c heme-lyase